MATEIKEVSSKRDLKSFIYFPFWLYSGNKYWVPSLIKEEKFAFDKNKNPFYDAGDARLYLVYKDRRIAGRVAVMAKHAELESENKMRFGWLDFEDDREVSTLLFEAIEASAKELSASNIEGPVNFENGQHEGVLIDGFQEKPTLASAYNHSYYQRHIEAWGFEKKHDLRVYKLAMTESGTSQNFNGNALPENGFTESKHAKKEMAANFSKAGNAFKFLAPFVPEENFTVLKNKGNAVAFSALVPSFTKSIQRAKGHLSLFASFLLMLEKRRAEHAELFLHIETEHQQKALTQFMISNALLICQTNNIKTLSSNLILESSALENSWQSFGAACAKKRRVYSKLVEN